MVSQAQTTLLICGIRAFSGYTSLPSDLLFALDSGLSSSVLNQILVSSKMIEDAIDKLKRGKSDSGTLVFDHIIEAHTYIYQFFSCLFTSVLKHGLMPMAFCDVTIQPIPKGTKNPSLSA